MKWGAKGAGSTAPQREAQVRPAIFLHRLLASLK